MTVGSKVKITKNATKISRSAVAKKVADKQKGP